MQVYRVLTSLFVRVCCPVPPQVPTSVSKSDGATLLTHDLFTNGVLYLEAGLDMRGVPTDLLPLVPLFCRSLTNMATKVSIHAHGRVFIGCAESREYARECRVGASASALTAFSCLSAGAEKCRHPIGRCPAMSCHAAIYACVCVCVKCDACN